MGNEEIVRLIEKAALTNAPDEDDNPVFVLDRYKLISAEIPMANGAIDIEQIIVE